MSKYSENMPPDIAGAIGWLLDYVKPGTDFLDFGCSTGYFGSYVKTSRHCSVYGVEISEDKKQARKVLDGVYSFDLDGEWPKKVYERKYDYLFFGDVLEHLKDPTTALQKARKLLKPEGKIFVSIPNIGHISVRLELLKGSFLYESMGILDNTHLQYFTLPTFAARANESGYNTKLVDFTANDIPREILEHQLTAMGLQASEKFWKITKTLEARAYQFKFVLTPQSTSSATIKNDIKKLLSEKPLQYRDDIISDLQTQLKAIDDHAREQAKIIEHFKQTAERLERENLVLTKEFERLEKPLSHKLITGYQKGVNRLKGNLKKHTKGKN